MRWKLSPPVDSSLWAPLDRNPLPYAGLATSLAQELDYEPVIEGTLPEALRGTLYRNGPGLFERGPHRKRMLLDGDGMVQALRLGQGHPRYRNRYVKTAKYQAESKAGRLLYPTWSTLAPSGILPNLGGRIANQAGVTVCRWGDRLLTFDENQIPYALDQESLETLGEHLLDTERPGLKYAAHWKIDRRRGELLNLSLVYGKGARATVTVLNTEGKVTTRHRYALPRPVYMHDWLVSDAHFIFVMHPAAVQVGALVGVLLGRRSYAEAVSWRPEQGNLIAVVSRHDPEAKPRFFTAEPAWMWHGLNAFEQDGELVADFVGSAFPGGLAEDDSPLFQLMRGEAPTLERKPYTHIRRYRIDLGSGKLREERLAEGLSYEMPYVNPELACHRHRYGYFAAAHPGELFWSLIVRLDTHTGKTERFDFGPRVYCSEPVFAPKPGETPSLDGRLGADSGWLLTQGYDSATKRSFVAILDSDRLDAGPLATVRLSHHVPLSFHGQWHAG